MDIEEQPISENSLHSQQKMGYNQHASLWKYHARFFAGGLLTFSKNL
jgi:hypothetical protein